MKLRLLTAAGAAAIMAVPVLATAQTTDQGWYLRGNVGYGTHTDIDLTGDLVGDVESEGNVTGSVGIGYDFGDNWRIEADVASLFTNLGKIDNNPASYSKLKTDTVMLNAIYDFSDFGRWEPYVGAGIGMVRGQTRSVANALLNPQGNQVVLHPNCLGGGFACGFADTDNGLAWQLIAGVGYDVTDRLTWDTQYRYMNSADLDFTGTVSPVAQTFNAGSMTMEDVGAHSIMTGFRYGFGPRSAPVTCWDGSTAKALAQCPDRPTPDFECWDGSMVFNASECPVETKQCEDGSVIGVNETCPPVRETFVCDDGTVVYDTIDNCPVVESPCGSGYRQEIIYYEFDRAQSAETRNAISRILDVGEFCAVNGIQVVGHTDTSGSRAYNQGLSERRAKDAVDELVRQGVERSTVTSEGKGETEPFVPTGDGVREQLNRRTEVLLTLSEVGTMN